MPPRKMRAPLILFLFWCGLLQFVCVCLSMNQTEKDYVTLLGLELHESECE